MMSRISISQAATQFGVSRRTLERWVRDGRLTAIPNEKDARQRLVDPDTVRSLIQQMPKRNLRQRMLSVSREPASSGNNGFANEPEPTEVRYQRSIDKALLQVYHQHRRLALWLYPDGFRELTLEQLREGPLGRDLRHLAAYAQGQVYEDSRLVRAAIDAVLQVLFWPAASEDYWVPRSFWDTDLARILNHAKLRSYKPDELVSLGQAARMLGVTIPTIYRWMDDRTIGWVRDDSNGRTWIVRQEIEQLKRKASELVARQSERALAS
jgi:excisionase family DNA binding protein